MVDANGGCTCTTATSNQRRPLLSQTETIQKLQSENLELRIKVRNLTQSATKDNDIDNRDLIANLMRQNGELRKQLEDRDKKEKNEEKKTLENAACQTNLDSNNVDDLVRAYVELKRMQEHVKQPYPKVTLVQQASNPNKQINPDEKLILDKLYKLDGCMTTLLDKVKAKSEIQ